MKKNLFIYTTVGKGIFETASRRPTFSVKRNKLVLWFIVLLSVNFSSCSDYLDVVPDNVATMEHAFKLRNEAQKYLFTCYSFLPINGDGWYNAGMMSADEIWLPQSTQQQWHPAFRIAQGQQNSANPLFNEWAGTMKGNGGFNDHRKLFRGIRHCNIFLENVRDESKIPDLPKYERSRWIAEVEFLKAFYHFYLLRMYGPIPIMEGNAPIGEPTATRIPVDSCFSYITNLLDQSLENLPARITDENNELGRITKSIALAVKAKVLLYAASPLFNGNTELSDLVDKDGQPLFNPTYDPAKWIKARDAALKAIQAAEENGHVLYEYQNDVLKLSDTIKTQLNIRNAVTNRWSTEHVWALSNSYFVNEALCMPPMERGSNGNRFQLMGTWGAPIKMAKLFYTKNGVPIEEDKTLDFSNYTEIRTAGADDRYYIEPNYMTARLNFDREARFYADLGFDGGVWYMKDGNDTGSDENTFYLKTKNTERAGLGHFQNWSETGYFIKKLVHWESTTNGSTNPTWKSYPWPEIRLAELYLMYAEAQNEVDPASSLAIEYLDKVRERAGLTGVVEAWSNYSTNPGKFNTQEGLREIIQQERMIELAFEGHRFWDLRRWKIAPEVLNEDITGFNILGKTVETYNNERVVFSQSFISPRDYFWPIGNYDIRRNPHLVENLGW